ncbi:hypothetical protein C8Q70DRAFT_1105893 [Cubamyces menziesii]|nr:hypothetical protein C8Q70DRAFT_1105893 [Cubamyces menziesii]
MPITVFRSWLRPSCGRSLIISIGLIMPPGSTAESEVHSLCLDRRMSASRATSIRSNASYIVASQQRQLGVLWSIAAMLTFCPVEDTFWDTAYHKTYDSARQSRASVGREPSREWEVMRALTAQAASKLAVKAQPHLLFWPKTAWYVGPGDPYGPLGYHGPLPPPIPCAYPQPITKKRPSRAEAAYAVPRAPVAPRDSVSRNHSHLDPLLVHTPGKTHNLPLAWDMALHPTTVQVHLDTFSTNGIMFWEYFRRCAAELAPEHGGQPLDSLTLIINTSSLHTKVKVAPGFTSSWDMPTTVTPYVSIWDVLVALYQVLQAPIDAETSRRLSVPEREAATLAANSRMRREARVLRYVGRPVHAVKNVNLLTQGRRFLGIRPGGRKATAESGGYTETFVVEIGGD